MKAWRVLLAMLAICCWAALAQAQTDGSATGDSEQNSDSYQVAEDAAAAFADGDYTTASLAYKELLVEQPKSAEFRLHYAKCLLELDDVDDAIAEYNTVLFYNPNHTPAKIGLSYALAIGGHYLEALAVADEIYLDEDYYIDAMVAKAHAHMLSGNMEGAYNWVGEALHFDPTHPAAQEFSRQLLARGGGGSAAPGPDASLDQLADYAFISGNNEEARMLSEELAASGSTDPLAFYRLGKLQEWDQDWDAAIGSYTHVIQLDPENYDARLRQAKIYWYAGYNSLSIDAFEQFIAIPDLPDGFYQQAIRTYAGALRSGGCAWQAVEMYVKALEFSPHDVELRAAYASTLAGLRCFNDALCQVQIALDEDPLSPAGWLVMGNIQAWQGNPEDALWMYNKVRPGNDYYPAAQVARASALNALGRREDALMTLGHVLAKYPDNQGACELVNLLHEVPRATMSGTWTQSHDTDDNDYVGKSMFIVLPFDPTGKVISIRYDSFTLDNTIRNEKSVGHAMGGTLTLPLNETSKIKLGGTMVEVDNGPETDLSEFNWNVLYEWNPRAGYRATVGYSDNVMYSTTHLARTRVRMQNLHARAGVEIDDDLWFSVHYADGELSDGNSRQESNFKLQQTDRFRGRGRFDYGINFQTLRFADDLNNGYWDPEEYQHAELFLDWVDLSKRDLKYDGSLGWGLNKDTFLASRQTIRYRFGLRYTMNDELTLRSGYQSSDNATTAGSGPGYENESWYFGANLKL